MDYTIRALRESETALLEDFLYEAIFVPEGVEAPPREIVELPEMQVYIKDFGENDDDTALVAEVDGDVVGAVWVRIMKDFGYVDDSTPSLSVSVHEEHRNSGIGTAMMKEMLRLLRDKGYRQTSLSVQRANYAVKMYEKLGYEVVKKSDEEYVMVCRL